MADKDWSYGVRKVLKIVYRTVPDEIKIEYSIDGLALPLHSFIITVR
jgi:hypothetical protein